MASCALGLARIKTLFKPNQHDYPKKNEQFNNALFFLGIKQSTLLNVNILNLRATPKYTMKPPFIRIRTD